MAMQASKFGTFLILFFVTPIMVEMDNILEIWLINPPDYAGMLCRWMLAILVLDKMTSGAMLAVNAHGKVAVYDPVQGLLILLSVPLMYLFISLKYGAHSIGYALFISMLLYCVARLVFGKYLVKLSFGLWIKQIAIPIFIILFSNMLIGLIIVKNIEVGFLRICLNIVIISISTMIIGWFILLNKTEKDYLINIISNKFNLIKLK
ncbi:MAG: hypothetical protein EAZ81_05650 [Verrucomicrobia bacterium]|nr:MAG: hypothetical protein EAZ81_05650 [Verrucomicrobiota bacterium]